MLNNLRFPQVLLLGNGLNKSGGATGWTKLLQQIQSNKSLALDESVMEKVPYPLLAVLATGNHIDQAIKDSPDLFYGCDKNALEQIRQPLQALLNIGFDEILTTNYSYELERVANSKIAKDGRNCTSLMRHTDAVKQAEPKYLLHPYNEVNNQAKTSRVWHIHGEVRKPSSIVLGHYYYGNLLQRYQNELSGRKNKQFEREKDGLPPILDSWLDAFIMGDVYVLGFGFDFSEFDLWWLLNRKFRETAAHGKVIFYEPSFGNELKQSLLDTYGVQVENMGFRTREPDHKAFYEEAIKDIQMRVKANKKE